MKTNVSNSDLVDGDFPDVFLKKGDLEMNTLVIAPTRDAGDVAKTCCEPFPVMYLRCSNPPSCAFRLL